MMGTPVDTARPFENTKKEVISARPTNNPASTAYTTPLLEISSGVFVIFKKNQDQRADQSGNQLQDHGSQDLVYVARRYFDEKVINTVEQCGKNS